MVAPTGLQLNLEGESQKLFSFETVDRRVADLEVRARIASANTAIGGWPVVRWWAEISHGETNYRQPAPSFAIIAGSRLQDFTMPARGMVLRLSARTLRLGFYISAPPSGIAATKATIQVSCQPAYGNGQPLMPYQQMGFPIAGARTPLPMDAREMRLTDFAGLPLAPAAVAVIFVGLSGLLLGPVDGASYADWRPIPHDAASMTLGAGCWVAYR